MSTDNKDTKISEGPRLFTEPSGVTSIHPPAVRYSYAENLQQFSERIKEAHERFWAMKAEVAREFAEAMQRLACELTHGFKCCIASQSPIYRYPAPPEYQPVCGAKHPLYYYATCQLKSRHNGMHSYDPPPKPVKMYTTSKDTGEMIYLGPATIEIGPSEDPIFPEKPQRWNRKVVKAEQRRIKKLPSLFRLIPGEDGEVHIMMPVVEPLKKDD